MACHLPVARRFADPDAYAAARPETVVRLDLLGPAPFAATLLHHRIGDTPISVATESAPRLLRIGWDRQAVGISRIDWTGAPPLADGRPCDRLGFVLLRPGTEFLARIAGPVRIDGLGLCLRRLEFGLERRGARPARLAGGGSRSVLPRPELARRAARLLAEANDRPPFAAAAARALEAELVSALLDALADPPEEDGRRPGRAIVDRALALIEAAGARPLPVGELAAELGITLRALDYAFRDQIGLPPKRYVTQRRLQLARRALLAADPARETVTSVATGLGFWELGRFALAYRAAFGELPSATLRGG
jgi:AraC-like DNA-binding protein